MRLPNVFLWSLALPRAPRPSPAPSLSLSRRHLLEGAFLASASSAAASAADTASPPPGAADFPSPSPSEIPSSSRAVVRLNNRVQVGDVRVGRGEPLKRGDVVVMHVRALLPDARSAEDTALFDTRAKNGTPLLHQLGTADELSLLTKPGPRPKVTVGLEDAILAGGTAPMRSGGLRKALVPADSAYGTTGMSRFDAGKSGFINPVGLTGFDIRYEIEVLRCTEVPTSVQKGSEIENPTATACCSDLDFPCQAPR